VCGACAVEMTSRPIDLGASGHAVLVQPRAAYEHCTACGEDLIPAGELDALFRQAVSAERTEWGLLTSEEIVDLRLGLNLTQARLEAVLGVGPKTVTRWENGTVRQSRIADTFMRVLRAHPELVDEAAGAVAREDRGPYRRR
jgi:HTH-type transcriptional regulator/antitoxin MqsA